MTTAQKIVNTLINETIFLTYTRWVIFEENEFMSKHTFQRINPSTYLFKFDLLHVLIFKKVSIPQTI